MRSGDARQDPRLSLGEPLGGTGPTCRGQSEKAGLAWLDPVIMGLAPHSSVGTRLAPGLTPSPAFPIPFSQRFLAGLRGEGRAPSSKTEARSWAGDRPSGFQ